MKKITVMICTFLLAGALLLALPAASGVYAAEIEPRQVQETPLPLAGDTPANQVTFADLGMPQSLFMQGPLASQSLSFSLPPDWRLTTGASLQLEFSIYLSNLIVAQEVPSLEGIIAGTLQVTFNGVALETSVIQGSGERILQFTIPDEALIPDTLSGMHQLTVLWDASASCELNLATSIAIYASSHLVLPHDSQAITPTLGNFPAPFFQESNPFPAGSVLVLPDEATQDELQAAVAVCTALGRLTAGGLPLEVISAGQLQQNVHGASNLILVGKPGSFSLLQNLALAQPGASDDGILQMFTSPWNESRALLWVGGSSDSAVLKAASALGSGAIVTSNDPGVAFISQMPNPAALVFDQDQTFADLNQGELTFSDFGSNTVSIDFYIPSGTSIGAEAYLDLVFNHSQLIDYLRSGIVVRINDVPTGSVRLSDTTANLNSVRIIVPASALHAGTNRLQIQVDLIPRNVCSDPRMGSLWVAVFPTSLLHLPVSTQPIVNVVPPALSNFPAPFTGSDLDWTTLVVGAADADGWSAAARLAFALGANHTGSLRTPTLLVADGGTTLNFGETSMIAVGLLPQMPFLASLGNYLPAPFDASGALSAATQSAVGFEVDPASSMGYLELAPSPSLPDTVLLAVVGSDSQGLNWAVDALLHANLRHKLEGSNFALIQGSTISAHDLAVSGQESPPAIPGTTPLPSGVGTPAAGETTPPMLPPRRDLWLIPVLAVSGALLIVLLGWEGVNTIKKKK